jgi:hypothetical protein
VSIRAEQQSSEKSCSCNSELWSVYTVIVCNCLWSNKSSCQSNTRLIIVATHTRDSINQRMKKSYDVSWGKRFVLFLRNIVSEALQYSVNGNDQLQWRCYVQAKATVRKGTCFGRSELSIFGYVSFTVRCGDGIAYVQVGEPAASHVSWHCAHSHWVNRPIASALLQFSSTGSR